jgi:hypothetical protein
MSIGEVAAFAVPTGLAAALAGAALGYVWGQQDALACVWNLRGVAECLDPPETDGQSPEQALARSRWVWKQGEHAGQPVAAGRWTHTLFRNPARGVPLLGAFGDRLQRCTTMDVAHGGCTYPRGDPRRG